jgi:hypothetical protein
MDVPFTSTAKLELLAISEARPTRVNDSAVISAVIDILP